ncbi:MAG: MFS transporter, partial [Candidatus Eiseniibacteriota bacterium]
MVSLGTWLQNTGAGWLMTSLNPDPLVVSMVQAATIVPIFLLALPAGAVADILDRRLFLIFTQVATLVVAALLAVLTLTHQTTAWNLLALTFLLGVGAAMTQPAWAASIPELVPRGDLVQAIALNGIGFNIARAVGPALAGVLVLLGGAGLAFTCNAVSFVAVIAALVAWRRRDGRGTLPREHFLSAIRAGMRYVQNTPLMRAAMLRAFVFFFAGAAPWGLLPLV